MMVKSGLTSVVLLLLACSFRLSLSDRIYDPVQIRDRILTRNPELSVRLGFVSELVLKLEELSSQSSYQAIINGDPQLVSDISRIVKVIPDENTQCDFNHLRTRLSYEAEFDQTLINFHPYVIFANKWIFTKCLYSLDSKMIPALESVRQSSELRFKLISERSNLPGFSKFKVSEQSYNGRNSDDASINLQARLMIRSVALQFSEEEPAIYFKHPPGSPEHSVEFREYYHSYIYKPCSDMYSRSGFSFDDIELITEIRNRYNISKFYEIERFHRICMFLGSSKNDWEKVYKFFLKYVIPDHRRTDFPEGIRDLFSGQDYEDEDEFSDAQRKARDLTIQFDKDGITLREIYNPMEIRAELNMFKLQNPEVVNSFSTITSDIVGFAKPSKDRCRNSFFINNLNDAYRIHSKVRLWPFTREYGNQQIQLCEGLIWLDIGEIIRDASFQVALDWEMLRTLTQFTNDLESQLPWPKSDSNSLIQSLADLFYLNNYPLPQGTSITNQFNGWRYHVCRNLQTILQGQTLKRWFTFKFWYTMASFRGVKYLMSEMSLKYVSYATLCLRTYRMSGSSEFRSLVGSALQSSFIRMGNSYKIILSRMSRDP